VWIQLQLVRLQDAANFLTQNQYKDTGPPIDTLMDDVPGSDNAHTETDYEYDSHRSVTPENEECPEESDYEVPDFNGRHINVPIDMGEAIALAFPVDMDSEYDINDERHIFDDGLEDDESEDSDASTSYEELTEPEVRLRVVEVPREDEEKSWSHSDDSADESYVHTSEEEVEEGETSGDAEQSSNTPLVARVIQVPASKSLDELQKAVIGQKRLEEVRDHRLWQLAELQEALHHIQSQIPEAEEDIQAAEASLIARQTDSIANIVASGISTELFQVYEDFCEDLHPEYGLRDGFSILCDQAHFGTYYGYDPVLQLFKDNVETDYETCNFRCEAKLENIIEFWPIQCPEPRTGLEITWGQQYVCCGLSLDPNYPSLSCRYKHSKLILTA
jgi:hypothetical protein